MAPSSFILASGSPRRRDLLASAGFAFEIKTAGVEELDGAGRLAGGEVALVNAWRKTVAVSALRPETLVLGADTVVTLGRTVFGKPGNREKAVAMLAELAGRTHEVITAVAFVHEATGVRDCLVEVSRVTFRPLGGKAIEEYLDSIEFADKAGAYAIQENGGWIVERLEGDRDNVIGLPLSRVAARLRSLGFANMSVDGTR